MKDYKRKTALLFGAVMVFNCAAHDTNTSHPRITEAIYKSLKSQDESITNYFQLYQTHPDYVTKLVGDAHYTVELDQPYPYLWGYDPQFAEKEEKEIDEDKASPNYPAFRKKSLNVLDGVVMEDSPTNRVMSHFQHAYTGAPMSVNDWVVDGIDYAINEFYGKIEPSEITAGRFFNDAVNTMGYLHTIEDLSEMEPDTPWLMEKHGRQLSGAKAMWLFGHALHHAEDMSSIAHIHGDAHLTKFKDLLGEPDDYEAHFIPSKIYEFITGLDTDYWFRLTNVSKTINNAGQIWGRKTDPAAYALLESYLDPANMSRGIYNTALFQADLPVGFKVSPLDSSFGNPMKIRHEGKYWRFNAEATKESYAAVNKLCGGGELSKMFYFGDLSDFDRPEGPSFNACGLRVNIGSRRALPKYEIMHAAAKGDEDSGDFKAHSFHYNGRFNSLKADWWEASVFGGPEDYYYIEQTMKGVVYEGEVAGKQIASGEMLLRPHYIRQDITKPHSANNPLIKTCTDWSVSELRCYKGDSLLERFAEKLIPYSLEFLVGYSQFFYDVANLPPYLQQVEVIQDERKRYGMKWQGKINNTGRIEMTHEEGDGKHTIEDFAYIAQRYKAQTIPNLSFITQDKAISINLKFNEAIRAPDAKNSEFSLGLALNEQQAFFDSRNLESTILADSSFKGCFTVGSSENLTSNCWQIKVPSTALKSLFSGDLNGRVTLLVHAADMNNHRDINGTPSDNLDHGALLDATPTTPARRYVKRSGAEYTIFDDGKARYSSQENHYYWHSDTSTPGDMFGTYANKQGAFAYHPGYDKNHILLFDSRKPEIRLEVTTGIALPEAKKE